MFDYWWFYLPIFLVALLTILSIRKRRSKPRETAKQAYIEGLRSMTVGDSQTAFIKLKQAVDDDTDNVDAYLKLGDLFRGRGLTDKALQIHRELNMRVNVPAELRDEINKSLVLDYVSSGMNDKARDLLQVMSKDGSLRNWTDQKLLDLQIKDKNWKEACEICEGIYKNNGRKDGGLLSNLKLLLGREHHENGEYHKARLSYKEALSLNESSPLPYLYIAESYLLERRIEDGLEFLKKLCVKVPHYSFLGFALIEETLFHLGKFGEVEDIYRGVLNLDPNNIPAKIALAGILEKKGDMPATEHLLRSILENEPGNAIVAIRLAEILSTQKRSKEGLDILSDIAEKSDLHKNDFRCKLCGNAYSRPSPACPQCGAVGSII